MTLAFLLFVALTGGASRVDVRSLILLKPAAVLACALALMTLRSSHLVGRKWMLAGFAAAFALCLIHLIPLPPGLWQSLPGREGIARVDSVAGLGAVWRPLTFTPMNAWHALSSLFVPLAVLLFAVQLNRDDLLRLLPAVISIGLLSGLLGLSQVIGGNGLYLYERTNLGSAVGLFANRNHAALLLALLFPMLAVWASDKHLDSVKRRLRLCAALACGVVLFPLILVTGSRSGLLISMVGLLAAFFMLASAYIATSRMRWIGIGAALAGVAILAFLTIYYSRAEAVLRLINTSRENEFRLAVWRESLGMLWAYFPVGSGAGSFVEAYQVIEPLSQLNPYYRNHVHNDLIETGLTFGLPGLLLILVSIVLYTRQAIRLWVANGNASSIRVARMAGVILFMIGAASLTDYPLRTPIMMCLFTLAALWLIEPARESLLAARRSNAEAN